MMKMSAPGANSTALTAHAKRHLIRTYPKGNRLDSSNYDPAPAWASGCQIVALNYQTADRPVWINDGMFKMNGGCGYVLKPQFMRSDKITWRVKNTDEAKLTKVRLEVHVMSAHFLPVPLNVSKAQATAIDPYVAVSISGVPGDRAEFKTKVVHENLFNPTWDQIFTFDIEVEALANLLFVIKDKELIGADRLIAQTCLPVSAIREGVRVLKLHFQAMVCRVRTGTCCANLKGWNSRSRNDLKTYSNNYKCSVRVVCAM